MQAMTAVEQFRGICRNPAVFDFARRVITASYAECASGHEGPMRELLDRVFERLARASADSREFGRSVRTMGEELFRKQDQSFWFNRLYHQYKASKPQRRFAGLREWLVGDRVLDFGCGDGLTSVVLQENHYRCTLTDVLDYRHERARPLPFHRMTDPVALPWPDRSFDTGLVFAVLHHVAPRSLPTVLSELRRVCRRLIVEEDSYDVPADTEGCAAAVSSDQWLAEFAGLTPEDQRRYLLFLDFFANAITQGLPQMDMPFEFRSVREWLALFGEHGLAVHRVLVKGFQPGTFNRTCHVWFVLDSE